MKIGKMIGENIKKMDTEQVTLTKTESDVVKKSNTQTIAKIIIILILVFIGGIGVYSIFQKFYLLPSLIPPKHSSNISINANSLFGTMIAFNINDAAMGMSGDIQKGWTQFRKDDSAYQNLLNNLEKLIQDRIKLVKTTGFSLDRASFVYFTWNIIEPQKGQFDWGLTDIYVKGATNAGVKISAVIQPYVAWDQKDTQVNANCKMLDAAYYNYKAGPPKDIAEYQNFLTKMVERYKDNVAVWEIGNEPDAQCSGYENNPQEYFNLLKISSETIKKAYPDAKVVNGGASGHSNNNSERNFWTKFFQLGGSQYIDYFNIHYNNERSPDVKLGPASFQEDLTFFNNLMDKSATGGNGRKPLYLTEFGIYSGSPSDQPPGQSAQEQGQTQTNVSSNQPINGKCGDNICDDFEKQNPSACSQDCGENVPSGNLGQPSMQPIQEQTNGQNVQPNQGQTLRNLSENDQAILYFKYSILAFANDVKVVFIDLIGSDKDIIGSSMAFNIDGKPRLFLTTLKAIDSKIGGFSKAEKIADGQYKFTVGDKTIYALWSGTPPKEISGKVKVTDIKGQEQIVDASAVKLSADQPVFLELQK